MAKILVVDDDEAVRLTLAELLQASGDEVQQAHDGARAWELLHGGLQVDVVCCDVRMPALDGIGLLQRVRGDVVLRRTPFVLVSGGADADTLEAAKAAAADGYVLKPFLFEQTRTTLATVLAKAAEAKWEHFLVTHRRLGLSLAELDAAHEAVMHGLEALAAPADSGCLDAQAMEALAQLASELRRLGVWRACELAEELPAAPQETRRGLAELTRLVGQRLAALRSLSP